MTDVWYWLVFALAVVLMFTGPAICARLEDWQDDRDAEAWSRIPGAIQ